MYLVTDPMPAEEVDYYIIDIDGTIYNAEPEVVGDQARLHWVLPDDLPNGSHTVIITAANAWGEGPPSDPFVFEKSLPGQVSGIGLSAD